MVVIDNGGRTYCTVWGDIMTYTAKALDKFRHEQEIVEQLQAGKTTLEIYGFDKLIAAASGCPRRHWHRSSRGRWPGLRPEVRNAGKAARKAARGA